MRWMPLLISILAVKSDCTEIHIIEFYGKFGWFTSGGGVGRRPDQPVMICADWCYRNPRCMAYQDDTCPANYTNVHFKMISPEGVIHPWKLGANGSWNFRFCFEGWKRFERSDNRVVCIKIVNESSISKYDLGQKCYYEKPFYASVAGVHSVEESVWMREEAAKYTSSGSEPLNYWTSGVRDGTCEDTDSYDKKNHFKWEDGMTTGVAALTEANSELSCKTKGVAKNCLVVMSQGPNRPQIFSDFECESTVSIGGGFCIYDLWRGIE